MPLVQVLLDRTKPETRSSDGQFNKRLADLLRKEVAAALTCADPGGQITSSDIEVEITLKDPMLHFGGEKYDIQITVWAGDYPTRRANLNERRAQITRAISNVYGQSNLRGYVWIILVHSSFGEF